MTYQVLVQYCEYLKTKSCFGEVPSKEVFTYTSRPQEIAY